MQHVALALVMSVCLTPLAAAQIRERDAIMVAAAVASARDPGDACGGRDLLDRAVPDGIFLEACRHHDACFRSGALDQGRCNTDFLHDMRDACEANFAEASAALQNAACQSAAYTYYRAVNSRFGAMLYPGGTTAGALTATSQRRVTNAFGDDAFEACADATNAANRKLRFVLALNDSRGRGVATAPAMGSLTLAPGETQRICVGTRGLPWTSYERIGPAYALTLKADDPASLNPFGDLVSLDRLDCDKASGACVMAAP